MLFLLLLLTLNICLYQLLEMQTKRTLHCLSDKQKTFTVECLENKSMCRKPHFEWHDLSHSTMNYIYICTSLTIRFKTALMITCYLRCRTELSGIPVIHTRPGALSDWWVWTSEGDLLWSVSVHGKIFDQSFSSPSTDSQSEKRHVMIENKLTVTGLHWNLIM